MGRIEAPGIVYPMRGLEQQKTMTETKSPLKWMGRAAHDMNGGEAIDGSPARQSSQKEDTGQRTRHSSPSVTRGEIPSARAKAQQTSSRDPSTETGRTGGRIIDQDPKDGENVAFELFKKEFIEKLAEKAKERPGYLQANEDFARPGKFSPKHLKQTEEDFVKPVQVHLEPKQTFEDLGKPRQADPKHPKKTETFERQSSFVGSPHLKRDILERTVRIIESSKTLLRSSSFDKRKSGAVQEKFRDPSWMSKCEQLNLSLEKQAGSNEGTSKDFILNKFFQTPTKPTSYEADGTDEEATSAVYLFRRITSSPEHKNGEQKTSNVGKRRDEKKNPAQVTMQREKRRESPEFVLGATLVDHIPFLRRDPLKSPSGSSGRRSSSDDTSKELSRSPGRRLSSEDRSKDSSRSPGRRLPFEDGRKDSSRSPGRRLSSEQNRNNLSRSPGRKIFSEERRTDFSHTSTRSIDGVFAAEDLRSRDQTATRVLNESRLQATRPESPGRQSNSGNRSYENEPEHESVRREKEALSKALKKAAAVDQAHFLRALQDAGAVQSSTPMSSESETNRPGYSSVKDTSLRKPSSPNRTKNGDNLREATGNHHRVDPRRDFSSEVDKDNCPTVGRDVGSFGSSSRSGDPSPVGRRDAASIGSSSRSREPSPTGRRDTVSFGSSTRSREPSPSGRRDAAGSFGSSTRSREPSPTGRREPTSSGSSSSTKSVRPTTQKSSIDSSAEKGSLRSGESPRKTRSERSQLPSGGNSPSRGNPRQLTRQLSSRSIGSDDTDSVSGGSIIEKLMRKASLRNSLSSADNQSVSSSAPGSPDHESARRRSSEGLRRSLSFAGVEADVSKALPESSRQNRTSSPTSGKSVRTNLTDTNLSERLLKTLNENNSTSHASSVAKKPAPAAPDRQHPLSNSLRVNVQIKESTIAKLKSRSSTSPALSDSEKLATVKTSEESCLPITTPPPACSVTPGGSPWSPGSDDSGSDASSIEQPSPVSVLSYNNRRTPFQEESRLRPLEHKIQVLHDRVRKSKTDVTNQKKVRLEKIKAREAELCILADLKTQEPLGGEVPKAPSKAPQVQPLVHEASDVEVKLPSATVIAATRDKKLEKARLEDPIPDFCTSLEKFDLQSILPCALDKRWDVVYIRDVLLASNFGRDRSRMTKWHSVTEPMDPSLFEKLEEFYRLGKKFSGSQFLSSLAVSIDGHHSMQEYVQRIFFNPVARHQGAVDTMNRCHLFDMVNETLAKKLVPYVAIPRPWMKPLAKPVVRPRATGRALMQEIWTGICNHTGNNGSMSMDKAQLHQSLEDLICEDLFKRTDLFPSREVERAAERVGIELERRILDDLLGEAIISLWQCV